MKAQNVEMVSRWRWQEFYSQYISRTFEKTITGTALNQTSQVLQKISQLMVLWIGASMVLKGELTLGQLIAFRIISGYVTQAASAVVDDLAKHPGTASELRAAGGCDRHT